MAIRAIVRYKTNKEDIEMSKHTEALLNKVTSTLLISRHIYTCVDDEPFNGQYDDVAKADVLDCCLDDADFPHEYMNGQVFDYKQAIIDAVDMSMETPSYLYHAAEFDKKFQEDWENEFNINTDRG